MKFLFFFLYLSAKSSKSQLVFSVNKLKILPCAMQDTNYYLSAFSSAFQYCQATVFRPLLVFFSASLESSWAERILTRNRRILESGQFEQKSRIKSKFSRMLIFETPLHRLQPRKTNFTGKKWQKILFITPRIV